MIEQEFGLSIARKLSRARDEVWPTIFDDLRRRRQLSAAAREINQLMDDSEQGDVARAALRRIGLEYEG